MREEHRADGTNCIKKENCTHQCIHYCLHFMVITLKLLLKQRRQDSGENGAMNGTSRPLHLPKTKKNGSEERHFSHRHPSRTTHCFLV
jgi:hypothetical protein